MPRVIVLNDVPSEARAVQRVLLERVAGLREEDVAVWLVRSLEEFDARRNELLACNAQVLVADLQLTDQAQGPMHRRAQELAPTLGIGEGLARRPFVTGLVLVLEFARAAGTARRGVVVASRYVGPGCQNLLSRLPIEHHATATMEMEDVQQQIAELVQAILGGDDLARTHTDLGEVLKLLQNEFADQTSTHFPHNLADRPEVRDRFRAWMGRHFPRISLEGDEACEGAYEALKGMGGGGHEIRLGTVALVAHFLGREHLAPLAISRMQGKRCHLVRSRAQDNATLAKQPALLGLDRLFRRLARQKPDQLLAVRLTDDALTLDFAGEPGDWNGLVERYRERSQALGRQLLEAPGKPPEVKRAHDLTHTLLAVHLLTGLQVHFGDEGEDGCSGALNFLEKPRGLILEVRP